MRFILEDEMILEHNGLRLNWNISNFSKKEFTDHGNDVTKHINQYWDTLPDATQYMIFSIFVDIYKDIQEQGETVELIRVLKPKIKALYDFHPIESLEQWVITRSDIQIPTANFPDKYEQNDLRPGNRIKTYIKADYIGLVSLTLALRLMIPIWGEFLYKTKGETGTNFKEYLSFLLLGTSNIISSSPMEKLRMYVENNVKSNTENFSAILGGVGTDDYPIWLLSLVVVRRLCIGNISGINPNINLVTFIFNFLGQKLTNNNSSASFGHLVRKKEFANDNGDDNNLSRAEGYKIKQEIATGDIEAIEYYMENPYIVAKKLDPNFDMNLLELTLKTTEVLKLKEISKHQLTLCQWVLGSVVSPRGFVYLSKQNVVNAIAITEAWLWANGHRQLSCLVSAISSQNNEDLMLSGFESRARITKEQMEILNNLFPFTEKRSLKQKTKPINSAVRAIDIVTDLLSQRDWLLTSCPDHVSVVTNKLAGNRYSVPHEIKILLANLVIDLERFTLHKLNTIK